MFSQLLFLRRASINVPLGVSRRYSGHGEVKERPKNPFFDPSYDEMPWGPRPRCKAGGKSSVTMALGVGAGREQMEIIERVFSTANCPVDFEVLDMSTTSVNEKDMENLIFSIERNGVAVKGNIEQQLEPQEISRNMQVRRALDLYVNLVEIKSYQGITDQTRLKKGLDVVVVRQNIEGEYAMLEHDNGRGIENLKITTEYNSRRVAEFAFQYARANKRRKVTVIYNKGFMNWSEGLFVESITNVAKKYPDVSFTTQSMRSFAFRMTHFGFNDDVLVTGVLYGGMILSLLLGLSRSSGLYCGQNIGDRYAVFEPAARNKGFKLAGKDLVNPVAALDCGVKLLKHLGHDKHAERIQRALDLTISEDLLFTQDAGGVAKTSEVVRNVERRIRESMPEGYNLEHAPPLPPLPHPPADVNDKNK